MRKSKQTQAKNKRYNSMVASDLGSVILDSNVLVAAAVDEISSNVYPKFSSALGHESAESCYTSLISHRIVSKFSFGDSVVDTKKVAFQKYITFEETHCKRISEDYKFWGPSKAHLNIRLASALLNKWCKNFRFDLQETFIEFTPGETFVSSRGDVSMAAKLSNRDHWTTTYNCLDLTVQLIYNNHGLKTAAKEHFGDVPRLERRALFARYHEADNVGFSVFRHLLIERVLTITCGARASSVPKNTSTDRFINIESMFPMMLQRIIAAALKKILARAGNGLGVQKFAGNCSAQELHQKLLKFDVFATIDFSNASDSVICSVIEQVFPKAVSSALLSTRSHTIDFGDSEIVPYKLSSMGNGFTFEVMTLLLYAVGTTFSDQVRVYGDDVIIKNVYAGPFIEACELIGFAVNDNKSFINSRFRESCGGFYHDDVGYLTSFDFSKMTSISDVITTANKLYVILNNRNTPLIDVSLVRILSTLHANLMSKLPVIQKGHPPLTEGMELQNLSLYAFDPKCRQKHKKNAQTRVFFHEFIDDVSDPSQKSELVSSVTVLVPRWKPLKRATRAKIKYLCLLHEMRVTPPTIKGQGKWILIPYFVTETGRLVIADPKCDDTVCSTFSSRHPDTYSFRAAG